MKFNRGDVVYHDQHGKGICKRVDETEKEWMYLFKFKDGTLCWMSKKDAEQDVSFAK